jgi:hypothetical protein
MAPVNRAMEAQTDRRGIKRGGEQQRDGDLVHQQRHARAQQQGGDRPGSDSQDAPDFVGIEGALGLGKVSTFGVFLRSGSGIIGA